MSDPVSDKSVAIVGAGIAGLSCARVLVDSGMSVSLFEKSRGPGGRMSTRRIECNVDPGADDQTYWQCDHGAQYFTARSPMFVDQVQRWEQAGVVAKWQAVLKTAGRRPEALHAAGQNNHRYVGTPRMTAPARHMAKGLSILCGWRVAAIYHTDQGWFLTQENATVPAGPFKYLVLAIPSQQAADLLASMPAKSAHHSSITQALTSCTKYALRPCWALMLNFLKSQLPIKEFTPDFDAVFVNPVPGQNHIASWIACDSSKPGRPNTHVQTWILHATPEWSEQHLESDQEHIFAALLSEFRTLTGIQAELLSHSLHRWRFAQTATTENCPGELWLNDMGLGLCGDWSGGGRVEGAWLSGYQLAHRML